MNTIILSGRLTSKPELRSTKSLKSVCNFTIAVNRPYTSNGKRETDFIECQVWNKTAENLCKYQDKGNLILVSGNIRTDSYDDEKGNKRYKTYVSVENIEYLSSKKQENSQSVEVEEPNSDQVYMDFGNEIELTDEDLGW